MGARIVEIPVAGPYDLGRSLSLVAMGRADPCLRVDGPDRVRLGLAGPEGPLAVEFEHVRGRGVRCAIRGAGAEWLEPALEGLLGLHRPLAGFDAPGRLRELRRRLDGLRVPRVPRVVPRAVQIVFQQQIAFYDACVAWSGLVRRFGDRLEQGLWAPPAGERMARIGVDELVGCGLLPKLARHAIAVAREGRALERDWGRGLEDGALGRTAARLGAVRGVGEWTLGMLRGAGLGDADAVVVGDYALPSQVAYFFEHARRGSDARMLELLEPFRPCRFDVVALLWKSGIKPARRAPREVPLKQRLGGERPPSRRRRS